LLQSCLTTDCERTTLSYAKNEALGLAVAVADGRVYWTSDSSFFSCAAEGCQGGLRTITADAAVAGRPIFAYRGHVYWFSDFDIYRCPAQGCGETPEVVAANVTRSQLTFDEDRVYWADFERGIVSVPSDGSEPPKLVIDALLVGNVAVRDGYLYWTAGAGQQVFRCQIANCASTGALLVTTDARITDLDVDGSAMYWLEASAIHTCSLPGCERSSVLTPPTVADPEYSSLSPSAGFALDASYLYWLETPNRPRAAPGYPYGAIRRTAR